MNVKSLAYLRPFFLGRLYPIFVVALVFLSHVFGLELFSTVLILASLCVGLLVTGSILPLISPLLLIFFEVSAGNSPSSPTFSGYLGSAGFLLPAFTMVALVIASLVFVLWKRGALTRPSLRSLPFLIPSGVLVLSLLLNGVFSETYSVKNSLFGLLEGVALTLVIYLFVLGFKGEDCERAVDNFVFISALTVLLLFAETLLLFICGAAVRDGVVIKDFIFYGWGVSNTCGQVLASCIPLLMLGAMRSRKAAAFYIPVTMLALVTIVITLSRSALLVAGALTLLSFVIGCFYGESKRIFRIVLPALMLMGAFVLVAFREKIFLFVSDLLDKGFTDNGRFALWQRGFDEFLENPLFGKGFFSFEELTSDIIYLYIGFFPRMLHNTVIELLAATGIVGLVSYLAYRFCTVKIFVKRPSLAKTMLGLSVLALIGQSLLDNFIFYVQPVFTYSIAIALALWLGESKKV